VGWPWAGRGLAARWAGRGCRPSDSRAVPGASVSRCPCQLRPLAACAWRSRRACAPNGRVRRPTCLKLGTSTQIARCETPHAAGRRTCQHDQRAHRPGPGDRGPGRPKPIAARPASRLFVAARRAAPACGRSTTPSTSAASFVRCLCSPRPTHLPRQSLKDSRGRPPVHSLQA
jgi:hypothetical protein